MKNRKANWIVTLATGFSLSVILYSCDTVFEYPYVITNNADTVIAVHYHAVTYNEDTIVYVEKDSTKLLVTAIWIGGGKQPKFRDVNEHLTSFTVTKNGMNSNRDYLKNDAWIFTVLNNYQGKYNTTVTNAEF